MEKGRKPWGKKISYKKKGEKKIEVYYTTQEIVLNVNSLNGFSTTPSCVLLEIITRCSQRSIFGISCNKKWARTKEISKETDGPTAKNI